MFPPRFISFHHAETAPSVDVHGRRQIKLVFTDHVLDVFISAIWKFLNQGEVDLAICEPIVGRVVNRPVFHKELHFVVPLAAVDINRNLVSLWDEVGSVAFGIGRQSITAKFPGQHRAAICQPIRLQPEFCTEEERLRKKEAAAVPEEEWARSKAEVRLTSRDDGRGMNAGGWKTGGAVTRGTATCPAIGVRGGTTTRPVGRCALAGKVSSVASTTASVPKQKMHRRSGPKSVARAMACPPRNSMLQRGVR